MVKLYYLRFYLFLSIVAFIPKMALADYSIIASPPDPYLFTYHDLWRFTVVSDVPVTNAQLRMKIDIQQSPNNWMVSGLSQSFQFSGTSLIFQQANSNQLEPVTMSFGGNSSMQDLIGSGGFFPGGSYQVTLELLQVSTSGLTEKLTETTYTLDVIDQSLLLLINPFDGDSVCQVPPVFTWVYAGSQGQGATVSYSLRIVEQSQGQSAQQAIIANPVFYEQFNISSTVLQYPVVANSLRNDTWYAWQVKAMYQQAVISSSEVWSFHLCRPDSEIIDTTKKLVDYLDVNHPDRANTGLVSGPQLNFRFKASYPPIDSLLTYELKNLNTHEIIANKMIFPLKYKSGNNHFQIELCGAPGISLDPGNYKLEIIDERAQKWVLKFIYDPKESCQ